jgi:hypothetical protein
LFDHPNTPKVYAFRVVGRFILPQKRQQYQKLNKLEGVE